MLLTSALLLTALAAGADARVRPRFPRKPSFGKPSFIFTPRPPTPPPPAPPGVDPVCVASAQRDLGRPFTCQAFWMGWTYSIRSDACTEVSFSGCGTGDNFFGSKAECEKTCKQGGDGGGEDVCALPPAGSVPLPPGTVTCQAIFPGWVFIADANACEETGFTGCSAPEGDNFFDTQAACEAACVDGNGGDGGDGDDGDDGDGDGDGDDVDDDDDDGDDGDDNGGVDEEDECDLPLVENVPPPPGTVTCQAFFSGWSFDAKAGECVEVGITGCGPPKGNFFDSRAACEAACVPH